MEIISKVCPFYDCGHIIANRELEYCKAYDRFINMAVCSKCFISCQKCDVTTKSEFYLNGEVLCSKCYISGLEILEQNLFLETMTVQEEIKRVREKIN